MTNRIRKGRERVGAKHRPPAILYPWLQPYWRCLLSSQINWPDQQAKSGHTRGVKNHPQEHCQSLRICQCVRFGIDFNGTGLSERSPFSFLKQIFWCQHKIFYAKPVSDLQRILTWPPQEPILQTILKPPSDSQRSTRCGRSSAASAEGMNEPFSRLAREMHGGLCGDIRG